MVKKKKNKDKLYDSNELVSVSTDEDNEFFKINTEILKNISMLFFDVYIQRGEKYVKVFKKNVGIDVDRIVTYENKGVDNLYIRSEHRSSYFLKAEQVVANLLQKKETPTEKKVEVIHEMTNLAMMEIFMDFHLDEGVIEKTLGTTNGIISHLSRDVNSMAAFIRSASSDFYLCKHSVAVCILSVLLAKADGNESDKILSTIGLGALLHDIGMSQISSDIATKKVEEMNPDEIKEYKLHPQYGMSMVQNSKKIPPEVRQIIYQHHEQPNGQGFPNFLRSADIGYMAKVVAIADSFSAFTTKYEQRETFLPYDALKVMQERVGVYDSQLLSVFLKMLLPKEFDKE
jgi:HD-GYP domain-containing protein (c-di-GMP phosphodiesterase class II)